MARIASAAVHREVIERGDSATKIIARDGAADGISDGGAKKKKGSEHAPLARSLAASHSRARTKAQGGG